MQKDKPEPILPPSRAAGEATADALLRAEGVIDDTKGKAAESGIFTAMQLHGHRRREYSNNEQIIHEMRRYQVAEVEIDELLDSEIEYFAARAKLGEMESTVWWLWHVEQMSEEEIGARLEIGTAGVEATLTTCRGKLVSTMARSPWYGWLEVYWSEVNRR